MACAAGVLTEQLFEHSVVCGGSPHGGMFSLQHATRRAGARDRDIIWGIAHAGLAAMECQ
jgi:hypothetical protein